MSVFDPSRPIRAVFLDRDGVINRVTVHDGKPFPPKSLQELEILPEVPGSIARLKAAGFCVVVVTNQPDIARGTQSADEVRRMHAALAAALPLDDVLVCPHDDSADCMCRKPRPGMLLAAADRHSINLSLSFMVGDRWRDVDVGHNSGCRSIFIDRQYTEQSPTRPPDYVCKSLADAAEWILAELANDRRTVA